MMTKLKSVVDLVKNNWVVTLLSPLTLSVALFVLLLAGLKNALFFIPLAVMMIVWAASYRNHLDNQDYHE